jgi:hypothetical protein
MSIFAKKAKEPKKAAPVTSDTDPMLILAMIVEKKFPHWRSVKIRRETAGISYVIDTGTAEKVVGTVITAV